MIAIVAIAAIAYFAPALGLAALHAIGISAVAGSAAALAASAVVAAALSIGVSAITGAIFAAKPSAAGGATPSVFRQSLASSFIVYGKRRVGGLLIFFHPKGKDYRYFVIAVAGHRCAGVDSWLLGDEVVTVDGNGKVTSGTYANNAWLWFYRGTADQVAHPTFVAETDGQWTAAHRGQGVALIYAKFNMVDAVVQAGMPNITAIIEGKDDIKDPRDDSVGYTRNAALVFYDWMALPREEGGFGCYPDELDDDWIAAQAGVCDEAVPLLAGGTEPRYELNAYITTGAAPSEIRDTLVTCCAGSFTYGGGRMLMRPGYYVPPSATMIEEDLAGPITVPALLADDQTTNEVTGTYIDATTNLYQPADAPTRSAATDEVRQSAVDLPHITSPTMAQRIMEIALRKALAERRVTWPMNIMGIAVSTLDTVQLGTARYGLSNYAFQVTGWGLSQDFSVVLTLEETNPDIFEWDASFELALGQIETLVKAEPIIDGAAGAQQQAIATSFPIGLTITAAADGTVNISDSTRRYNDGHGDVAVAGATIATGLSAGTFRAIGYDDVNRTGGAVVYQLFDNDIDARASPPNPGRHYVGYVTIPTAGSPPADGGGASPPGGNCVTEDTPIMMADGSEKPAGQIAVGDRLWTRHEATLVWGIYPVEAIAIVISDDVWQATIDGRDLSATGDHLVYTGTWVAMRDIGKQVGSANVVKMTVTSAHTYVSNGILSHNIKNNQQPQLD